MKLGLRGALGIAVSVALLAFALRDVSFAEVWAELRRANAWYFAGATVLGTLTFPLRARRWRTILEPVAAGLPFGPLWRSTAIGAMVNNVVPARAGEIARAFALTRETPRVGFSASLASLAVDRLFDAIVVLLLLLLAMLDPAFGRSIAMGDRSLVVGSAVFGATGLGAVLVILYAIVAFPAQIIRVYEAFARRVAPRFEERGRAWLRDFADGLGVLRHPGRFVAVLWWTALHWLVNAAALWLGFRAVGIAVPFSAALLVQGLIAIGVALPAAPGFFGTFELIGKAGLAIYGVPGTLAVSWALGFHLLTFVPITLLGAFYFVRLGLHFRDLKGAADDDAGAAESGAESAGAGRAARAARS